MCVKDVSGVGVCTACTHATSAVSHGGHFVCVTCCASDCWLLSSLIGFQSRLRLSKLGADRSRCWPRNKETPGVTRGLSEFHRPAGFISKYQTEPPMVDCQGGRPTQAKCVHMTGRPSLGHTRPQCDDHQTTTRRSAAADRCCLGEQTSHPSGVWLSCHFECLMIGRKRKRNINTR